MARRGHLPWVGFIAFLEQSLNHHPGFQNSWNYWGCSISEEVILDAAHALVSTGLNRLGYEYVVIDDCWHAPARSPHEPFPPVADPVRFPSGIKVLADMVHALGLKLGIYSSAGTMTCAKQYGSLGYEEIDAKTWKEWGIDYVKYDNCYNEGQAGYDLISYNRYAKMSKALNETGRPMVYAMCNWGEDGTWNWAARTLGECRETSWTQSYDAYDDRCPCESAINCKLPGFHCSMIRILEYAAPLVQKAGPGQWNDLDMLEVGNGGMTTIEYQTHFAMWAVIKSPLILGHNLATMDQTTKAIITNKWLIQINQDPLGMPAIRVRKTPIRNSHGEVEGNLQIWSGPLQNGAVVAVVNTSPNVQTISYQFQDVYPAAKKSPEATYRVIDVWALSDSSLGIVEDNWGKSVGEYLTATSSLTFEVPAHGTVVNRWYPLQSKKGEYTGSTQKVILNDEL
ncbi:glycoside hydrolase [Serendipita vermifera]|nr:glycoside hydrolase [Serendipita vermifera]